MKTEIRPPKPSRDGMIAVIVEPRRHPLLEYTVKQVLTTLGPSWSLQMFVSSENEFIVRKAFDVSKGGAGENILIERLGDFGLDNLGDLGNRAQSALSAHEKLYLAIPSEHIFWFQVDVVLRGPVPSDLLTYAYIGSEWQGCQHPGCTPMSCSRVCSGGNSGVSLRRRSKLLRVATKGSLPEELWGKGCTTGSTYFVDDELHNNSLTKWFEDDLQISFKLSRLNMLPPGNVLSRFAVGEALPKEGFGKLGPVGLHKPWLTPWIPPEAIFKMLEKPLFDILQYRQ